MRVRSETPVQLLQCKKCQEPDVEARGRQRSLITEGKEGVNNSSQMCATLGAQAGRPQEGTVQEALSAGGRDYHP